MPGLIDFFLPERAGMSAAWSQLVPSGELAFPLSDFTWDSLRPRLNPWDVAKSPLGQSINWLGAGERAPFARAESTLPIAGAADAPSLGRSSYPVNMGPGPDDVFAAYDRLKAAAEANKTNAWAPANAATSGAQPAWNIPPPDQRDLEPWAPTQAQTIEGRETGPSDSWDSVSPPRSATPSASYSPDGASQTGPGLSDWFLPSAAKPTFRSAAGQGSATVTAIVGRPAINTPAHA
jgi:hypothetical protein